MLPELKNYPEILEVEQEELSLGVLTKIIKQEGIRHCQQIGATEGAALHVAKIPTAQLWQTIYFIVSKTGKLSRIYLEESEKSSYVFKSPDRRLWTMLSSAASNREELSVLPLRNRKSINRSKKIPSFTGEWLGNTKDTVYFHLIDFFEEKPDELCALKFDRYGFKQRKIIKLPLPNKNYIYFEKQGYLQLLTLDKEQWIHRRMDINGVPIKERTLDLGEGIFVYLYLSFNAISELLNAYENNLTLLTVHPNRVVERKLLVQLPATEIFYNLSAAVSLMENRYLVRFTTSSGNGWLVMQYGKLLECFFYEPELKAYQDVVSKAMVPLPRDGKYLVSGVTATDEGGYQLTLARFGEQSKEILVFSHNKF